MPETDGEQCQELERLERKYDFLNTHNEMNEITGIKKTIEMGPITDINGTLTTDLQQKMNKWTEYISHFFDDKDKK